MSAVPPSPAKPTTLNVSGSSPWASRPARMPVSTDAVAAKGVMKALLAKHSWGKLKPTALMQPAGSAQIVRGPRTLRAWRTTSDPAHPAQALWP